MKTLKSLNKRMALLVVLALIMVVGLWYGRPMAVASACGDVDWSQVDAFHVTLSDENAEPISHKLAAGEPLTQELIAVLEKFYCTHQFNDQIPIDRGEKNVVTFSGGSDLSIQFTWAEQSYTLLLTNEALFIDRDDYQQSYMPLRRAEPRQEILALFQEV